MTELSCGLMSREVEVTVNKTVFAYDLVMVIGPVFPHEVVGFSGGNKYFFPGISGQEIIDAFHWLGALIGSAVVIGTKSTPVRAVVDRAAAMLPMDKLCASLVVKDGGLAGLYIGSPEESWSAAADLSTQVNIEHCERPFDRVLSQVPEMYPDLWTGAKGMYKLEPVVADGGELIIYGPHISEVSATHGEHIESIGYHVCAYFLAQMERFESIPGGVLAHSTHVKGAGSYVDGEERPRIEVVLATGISEETCRRINLGYRDPESIDVSEWRDRQEEGVLYVPRAGEILYRLTPGSPGREVD
jgi:nickel-dependent lactate racemase